MKSLWDRGSWEGNQSDGEAEVQELRYPKQRSTAEHSMFPPCCCLGSERTLQSHQQGGTGSTEAGDEIDQGRLTENLSAKFREKKEELCFSVFYEDGLESFCKGDNNPYKQRAGHFSSVV